MTPQERELLQKAVLAYNDALLDLQKTLSARLAAICEVGQRWADDNYDLARDPSAHKSITPELRRS